MSDKTGIQWTDATWNPVSGCSKVSLGCKNCYAERDWARLSKNPKSPYFGRAFTDVKCHPERLDQPLRWRAPRRIFVNSMSDLFHEDVPSLFISHVFAIMALTKEHTFQILTKRPARMREYLLEIQNDDKDLQRWGRCAPEKHPCSAGYIEDRDWPLANVWLGVSVENQAAADERIPILLDTPAAVRFLSVEPLLEHVDLGITRRTPKLDWVIIGGESGPNARPCNVDWIRSILNYCRAAKVPAFVKQLGANPDLGFDEFNLRGANPLFDRHGGDPAEWPADLRIRGFPR